MDKTPSQLHPVIREVLACHEGFRRLGFSADDIYLVTDQVPKVHIALVTQGTEFHLALPISYPKSSEDLQQEWGEAVVLWNEKFTDDDMTEIWASSYILQYGMALITQLMKVGITPPIMSNMVN